MWRTRRAIKHFWQRTTRGFDDSETWDLDATLCRWLLPRLKRYREISPHIIADSKTEDGDFFDVVDRIISSLEFVVDDPICEMSTEEYIKACEEAHEGLKLLGKYMRHLWF